MRISLFGLGLTATIWAGILLSGCTAPVGERHPALPAGFEQAQIPNVPFNVFILANQGQPIPFSAKTLSVPEEQAANLAAERMAIWTGPGKDAVGLQFILTKEEGAQALEKAAQDPETGLVLVRKGTQIVVIRGKSDWSVGLRAAIENGDMVSFKDTYPEAWENIQLLPEKPPRPPVAAGVLIIDDGLLSTLSESGTSDLRSLGMALKSVPTKGAAFAVYGSKPLALPPVIDAEYMRASELRVVVALRTKLVGPLLGGVLNTLAGSLNLEKVEVGGQEVLRYQQGDVTALLVPRGGTLYVVAAPGGPAQGEDLLAYLDATQ